MALRELQGLAEDYGKSVLDELQRKQDLASVQAELKEIEILALRTASDAGEIDGKNAEARKLQSAAVIADSKACASARYSVDNCQCEVDKARAECARLDAEIGLTKAWLYSQARIG